MTTRCCFPISVTAPKDRSADCLELLSTDVSSYRQSLSRPAPMQLPSVRAKPFLAVTRVEKKTSLMGGSAGMWTRAGRCRRRRCRPRSFRRASRSTQEDLRRTRPPRPALSTLTTVLIQDLLIASRRWPIQDSPPFRLGESAIWVYSI